MYRQASTFRIVMDDAYFKQLDHAGRMEAKARAAIIMQAWIDGYEVVCEISDEIVLQKKKKAIVLRVRE